MKVAQEKTQNQPESSCASEGSRKRQKNYIALIVGLVLLVVYVMLSSNGSRILLHYSGQWSGFSHRVFYSYGDGPPSIVERSFSLGPIEIDCFYENIKIVGSTNQ